MPKRKVPRPFVGETLLDTEQAAEFLGVSKFFVLSHTRDRVEPVIPSMKLSRNVRRFRKSELDAFLSKLVESQA